MPVVPGLVSVVIPVFNGERYLRTALDSALAQTYSHLEVVAVDDGSRDGSAAILDCGDPRVVVISQANQGVSAARNAALAAARGEFIAFLDQDDWWHAEKLQRQVALLRGHPQIGFVHTAAQYYDDVAGCVVQPFNTLAAERLVGRCFEILALGNGICNSTVMIRRSVLSQTGGLSTEIRENTVQDYELWLRCAQCTEFGYIAKPLISYRLHPGQAMWNVRESHRQLVRMLERTIGSPEDHAWRDYKHHMADLLQALGIEHLDANELAEARRCFRRALALRPGRRISLYWLASHCPGALLQRIRIIRSAARAWFRKSIRSAVPDWTGRVNNNVGSQREPAESELAASR